MMYPVVGASEQRRMSETVRQAVIEVCRTVFYYKDDVKSVFLAAGLPPIMWERHDHGPSSYKVTIAKLVLSDLRDSRKSGARQIERDVVEELCRWEKPHHKAEDKVAGKAALVELRRVATEEDFLISPKRAAAEKRREDAAKEQAKRERRQQQIADVRARFYEMGSQRERTPAEIQRRGYDLEVLLADLFAANGMEYRKPYKATHEQIDGAFTFKSFTYLVEAKWEANPPSFGDLAKFKAKVDGKMESVRGMFLAIAGFNDDALDHFFRVARNSRNNMILMNKDDLVAILEGYVTLEDALLTKVQAAEQRGEWWCPLVK